MKTLGYYNGNYGPLDEMTVPMNDRACYFGDGVYEAAMAANGKIFALSDHLDRFFNSSSLIDIDIPYTKDELADILTGLLSEMDDTDIMVYWQLSRGTAPRNHAFPPKDVRPNLWVTMKPMKAGNTAAPIKLTMTEDIRFLMCNVKTLNLLPNVLASQKAESCGCAECVFHRADIVTECAHSNVSIIKDGVFRTHPTDNLILPGVTRKHIIEICKKEGIPVDETPFTVDEMMNADEVIVSSTTKFVSTASEIDGRPVGSKAPELIDLLKKDYMEKFISETA